MEDLETIQRCRDRDKSAFEALYQVYALKALRTAFLMTHQSNLAEDAVQETFVQVWTSIDKLRDVHAFRAWFFRILINRVKYLGKRTKETIPYLSNPRSITEMIIHPDPKIKQNEMKNCAEFRQPSHGCLSRNECPLSCDTSASYPRKKSPQRSGSPLVP